MVDEFIRSRGSFSDRRPLASEQKKQFIELLSLYPILKKISEIAGLQKDASIGSYSFSVGGAKSWIEARSTYS